MLWQLSLAKVNTVSVSSTTIRLITTGFILHSKNLTQQSTADSYILYYLLVISFQKEKETPFTELKVNVNYNAELREKEKN